MEKQMIKVIDGGSEGRTNTNEWLMEVARFIAQRSKCPEGKRHGAVIALNRRIISIGYNGPAAGSESCIKCTLIQDEKGKDWRSCPAVHAEINALMNAVSVGISVKDCTIFITKEPCINCESQLINSGITKVIFPDKNDARSLTPFDSVLRMAIERQKDGVSRYGRESFRQKDMHNEMVEELIDVMVYAYLEILKVWEMKNKKASYEKNLNKEDY